MAVNEQYSNPPFGLVGDYASTGAEGSEGDHASQSLGPVIGSPAVLSGPYQSSQLPVAHVDVTTGDTSGMSSDQAVGDRFAAISGSGVAGMSSTGAGTGSAGHTPHPNAGR